MTARMEDKLPEIYSKDVNDSLLIQDEPPDIGIEPLLMEENTSEIVIEPLLMEVEPLEVVSEHLLLEDNLPKIVGELSLNDKPPEIVKKLLLMEDKPPKIVNRLLLMEDKPPKIVNRLLLMEDKPLKIVNRLLLMEDKPPKIVNEPLLMDDKTTKPVKKASRKKVKTRCEDWNLPMCYKKRRHTDDFKRIVPFTNMASKERMKTVSVALVLCLNVGVDPPDVLKIDPCACLETWVDPDVMTSQKALEVVARNLQRQYERWQPRARYKNSLDPTIDEVRKLCMSLRRNAKDERVLFHYNGHGVPKPTANGEIWVFNRNYTQYIPLSIYDLQEWMGTPSVYVYDCSNAGMILKMFDQFAEQREKEPLQDPNQSSMIRQGESFKNCILLGPCDIDEQLPMHPDLPADVFTSCLTTPIRMAARWFVVDNVNKPHLKKFLGFADNIPGVVNDRKTMLGELNWIFTAITDAIAWDVLPQDTFFALFRQDLLVSSLFRNYLLAERVLRRYDCTTVSKPKLPPMFDHRLWKSWDHIIDMSLCQLRFVEQHGGNLKNTTFFDEQLTAFDIWTEHTACLPLKLRDSPEQLPMILQVLLSPPHRPRALHLIGKFLDLGPWAVNLTLCVGLFPYILRLLQSFSVELRPTLSYVWAKIMAVDHSCQADIIRVDGFNYFTQLLNNINVPEDQKVLGTIVLSHIMQNYRNGQQHGLKNNLVSICLDQLSYASAPYKQWLAFCLAQLWDSYDKAREVSARDSAHEKLFCLLEDRSSEVRAAAVYALGTYVSCDKDRTNHSLNIVQTIAVTLLDTVAKDISPMVREEVVIALQWTVFEFEKYFIEIAKQEQNEIFRSHNKNPIRRSKTASLFRKLSTDRFSLSFNNPIVTVISPQMSLIPSTSQDGIPEDTNSDYLRRTNLSSSLVTLDNFKMTAFNNVHSKIWKGLTTFEQDIYPDVSANACKLTNYIKQKLKCKGRSSNSLPTSPSSRSFFSSGVSIPFSVRELRFRQRASIIKQYPNFRTRQYPPNTIFEETNILSSSVSPPNIEIIGNKDKDNSTKSLVRSHIFESASKLFTQPMYTLPDDHTSMPDEHYERDYKYGQNFKSRKKAREDYNKIHTASSKIEHQIFSSKCKQHPNALVFHPYSTHIVTATNDYLMVWDYHNGYKVNQWKSDFRNNNLNSGPPLSAVELLNSHDDTPLLLAGYKDGNIQVWSEFMDKTPRILSGWNGLDNDKISSLENTSLVLHWDPKSCHILCGGNTKTIQIWDVQTEIKLTAISTGVNDCTTSMSMQLQDNNTFVAGFNDGSVIMFDKRLPPDEAKIATFQGNSSKIISLSLRDKSLISVSAYGDVKTYECGQYISYRQFHVNNIHSATFHPLCNNVIACTEKQLLTFYDTDGKFLSSMKLTEWYMSSRYPPLTAARFHPHKIIFATGAIDGLMAVYTVHPKK